MLIHRLVTLQAAGTLLSALARAQNETTNVDVDGDGMDDSRLESNWSKNRWEWGCKKYSWVTNLSGQLDRKATAAIEPKDVR